MLENKTPRKKNAKEAKKKTKSRKEKLELTY